MKKAARIMAAKTFFRVLRSPPPSRLKENKMQERLRAQFQWNNGACAGEDSGLFGSQRQGSVCLREGERDEPGLLLEEGEEGLLLG